MRNILVLILSFLTSFNAVADEHFEKFLDVKYSVSNGWKVTKNSNYHQIQSPNASLTLYLVVGDGASNVEKLVTNAFKQHFPGFNRGLLGKFVRPTTSGWDTINDVVYKSAPSENLSVAARVWTLGKKSYAVIGSNSKGEYQRRGSEMSFFAESLAPINYSPETYLISKALPIKKLNFEQLSADINRAKKYADIPGVAVALFTADEIIFKQGFGVKKKGEVERISPTTKFMIASNTKALTTLLLAKLVDEGRFNWDTPVVDVYPKFRLGNDTTTQNVQIKHLVCACTGLPRNDLEWLLTYSISSPELEMARLAQTVPTTEFGELYQYSNTLAAAAGYVAAYSLYPNMELNLGYNKAMHEYVFTPLNMNDTTLSINTALSGNAAWPHSQTIQADNIAIRMDMNYSIIPNMPAGGAWSTVLDYAKYLQLELSKGEIGDKQYISEKSLVARREPMVSMGSDSWYGMGLIKNKRKGISFIEHGGSLFGYKSNFFIVPELNLGGVILTNADNGNSLTTFVRNRVLEMVFNGKQQVEKSFQESIDSGRKGLIERTKDWREKPSKTIHQNIGKKYTNEKLGDLFINNKKHELYFTLNKGATLAVAEINDPELGVSLVTKEAGVLGLEFSVVEEGNKISQLVLRDPQSEYVFKLNEK
jgi:CubicO group peptidase (beta-lactamase class C family)